MATDREKDRDSELESAMYTNCLLLGFDPGTIVAAGAGWNRSIGHFRHSNPRLGEKLLHFLLSSLRGPVQSAKDFDRVWPISDSSQSRDFRKIVQSILSELESKGALPRNNARVSSLATCCGPRFVELLWQLSVHALREVHRRTFSIDVSSNPLPASLSDASYQNAAALLPITKARIALERRKFIKNANIADHKQATWVNLANEMTSEFRELHAEEAYLQQELEKLQEMRNKAKLDGEFWDDRISSSSVQNSLLVSKASRLWDSLLSRKSQHEALASGPIEDLITHREHRYRISGSSLVAAMNSCSLATPTSKILSSADICEQNDPSHTIPRADDQVHHTVDVAEILRRWTHALQNIHKQTMTMAKTNDGEGPELLNCISENSHAEALAATLSEHQQHLVSMQGLTNQLKAAAPALRNSIKKLTEELKAISPISLDEYQERSLSFRTAAPTDEITQKSSSFSFSPQKASSKPALKLPQLFNPAPSWLRHAVISQPDKKENSAASILAIDDANAEEEDSDIYAQNLRRAVREAALSRPPPENSRDKDKASNAGSEHFFVPFLSSFSEDIAISESHRDQQFSFHGSEQSMQELFSPSYFKNEPAFDDCYEDLLAPLSDTDAALMETSSWLQNSLPLAYNSEHLRYEI